jgi:hypothetical protein
MACPVTGGDDEKEKNSLEKPSKRWMDGRMDGLCFAISRTGLVSVLTLFIPRILI